MKRIIFILSIFMIAISCNSLSTSEKSIQEYMRTQTGSPDLEIEFTNVQITKQTVGDSIDILQKIFEEQIKEKEKTIKRIENDNQAWQKELESMSKKDQNYAFLVQMVNSNQRRIKELQEKVIKNGTGYYDGRDPKKVIATLVKCEMTSLINPVLKAKQTKEGVFLLTPDETVCIRQIK